MRRVTFRKKLEVRKECADGIKEKKRFCLNGSTEGILSSEGVVMRGSS